MWWARTILDLGLIIGELLIGELLIGELFSNQQLTTNN